MAQVASANIPRPLRKERQYSSEHSRVGRRQADRSKVRLYFPRETKGFRTPFRAFVYRLIFEEVDRIAHQEIESFELSVWSHPGEEDSWTLVMTIFLDAEWDRVKAIRRTLIENLDELSREWSSEQREDYQRRIHFEVFPTQP